MNKIMELPRNYFVQFVTLQVTNVKTVCNSPGSGMQSDGYKDLTRNCLEQQAIPRKTLNFYQGLPSLVKGKPSIFSQSLLSTNLRESGQKIRNPLLPLWPKLFGEQQAIIPWNIFSFPMQCTSSAVKQPDGALAGEQLKSIFRLLPRFVGESVIKMPSGSIQFNLLFTLKYFFQQLFPSPFHG